MLCSYFKIPFGRRGPCDKIDLGFLFGEKRGWRGAGRWVVDYWRRIFSF